MQQVPSGHFKRCRRNAGVWCVQSTCCAPQHPSIVLTRCVTRTAHASPIRLPPCIWEGQKAVSEIRNCIAGKIFCLLLSYCQLQYCSRRGALCFPVEHGMRSRTVTKLRRYLKWSKVLQATQQAGLLVGCLTSRRRQACAVSRRGASGKTGATLSLSLSFSRGKPGSAAETKRRPRLTASVRSLPRVGHSML